jgi:hypothetical protein
MKIGTVIKIDYYDFDKGIRLEDIGYLVKEGYVFFEPLSNGGSYSQWMIRYVSFKDNLELGWSHQDPYVDYDGSMIYEVFYYLNAEGDWVEVTTKEEWEKLFDKPIDSCYNNNTLNGG